MSTCTSASVRSAKNKRIANVMVDTAVGPGLIRSSGGKWIVPISPAEIQAAFGDGSWPSVRVLAAASTLVDQLREMEVGFLVMRGRPYSRSVRTILEYYNIRGDDLQTLVRLLAHLQVARPFFNLAVPSNDDGLKQYLIDAGVSWEQVLYYYEFSLWDPVRFTGSFILGLGYSVASILEVLKELFDFGVDAFDDPGAAAKKIVEFIDGLRQLSFESLAQMAKEEWAKWQKEFSQALLDLDFDRAGFMLGKLAGDLWQILTGIRLLAKLPGMTIKLARRFAVLFSKGARYARRAVELLVELLNKLSALIQEAVTIGYRAVANFFEDTALLLEKLEEGALLIIDKAGAMIINIPPKGLVLEGVGFLPEGYVLAQASEGVTTVIARVRVEFEKGLKYVNDLKGAASRKVKQIKSPVRFIRDVKRIEALANRLVKEWKDTLQKIFSDKELKLPLNSRDLGIWMHDHLQYDFERLAAALIGKYKSLPEIQIRKLATLIGDAGAVARADVPLLDFAKQWPGMFEALGVADEKELAKFLKKMGYDNPAKTLIGDLISDGVLYDDELKRLISVDWTSGLGKYRFANEYEKAIKAAGEALTEAQKMELAKQFLKHTFREYALREAILEFVFEGWDTKVIEIMYEPFRVAKK
jgi:hypothetical protein